LKTIKKLVIIVVISLITLLVLGTVLYRVYFAPKVDRYLTETVQKAIAKQFKREVSIGSIHLDFPALNMTISDMAIARKQKLSEGTLLSAKMLKAKVLLRSLVSKRIIIDAIVLDTPKVWIEFDEQGQSNLPSFGGGEKKKESRFNLEELVERLYFPHIQLIDGSIHFVHQKIPLTVSVQRLNTTFSLALKGLLVQGNISLQGGEVEFQNRGKMAVAMSGDLKFEEQSLTLASFSMQVNRSTFTVDGTLSNIPKPDLNLSVKSHLALEELDRFLRINQNLSGMVAFAGTVTGKIPDVTATGHLTCLEGSAWKLNFKNVSTDATYQQKQVIIANLDGDIFGGRATGNGKLSFSGTPRYQASLMTDNLNGEYVNTFISRQLPLEGKVSGKVEVQGDSFSFEDLIFHALLNLHDVNAYNVRVPQATGQVDIKNKTLYITGLQAEVFQGKASGNGSMVLSSDPNYQAVLDVQTVELDPIMALIPARPDVSGRVSGKITASGARFDLDSLKLEADLNASNVEAYAFKAKTLNTSLQIQKGVLDIARVSAQLFGGEVAGQGKFVLTGETVPKFQARTNLKHISVQSIIQQFASNVANNHIVFDGSVSGDVTLEGKSYTVKDLAGTAALSGKGDVSADPRTSPYKLPFDLLLNCSLSKGVVTISNLDVDSATLMLSTSGTVNLARPELKLTYQAGSKDLQTLMHQILAFIPGIGDDSPLRRFSGNIEQVRGTVQGPLSALQIQADVRMTAADVLWAKADNVTADVIYQNNTLVINHLRAVHKSADVEASGSIDLRAPASPRLELPISLKSGNVSDYLAMVKQEYPIEGTLKAVHTTISGTVNDLHGQVALEVQDITAWKQSFDQLSGKLELANNRVTTESLNLKKNGGLITVKGFVGFDLSFRADLTATNLNFHDIDAFKNIAVQYQGLADLTLETEGTLKDPRGKAAIRFKHLVYKGRSVEDITCDVVIANQTLQATLGTFQKKFSASVQLSLTSELLYRVEMVMKSAPVEQILSLATSIEGISGLVTGKITSEGSLQNLQKLSAIVKLSEVQLDIFGQQVQNSKEIDVVITPQKLTVNSLELRGKELGLFARGFLNFQGNFDLDLDGILDMRPFLPFLPKTAGIRSLDGRVQLICSVRGTFLDPEIEGVAEVNHGSVRLATYPDPVTNINGKLAFTKGQIEILQLQGNISKGSFEASGTFDYRGITPDNFKIDVKGKNIFVHDVVEALTLTASPHIRISGNLTHQKLAGEVLIHNALYKKELNLQALIFEKSRKIAFVLTELGKKNGHIELDLLVKAPKDIQIRNSVADLDLQANLRIHGTTTKPQLEGRVEVVKGKAQFGDITYQILSGSFNFMDPLRINPEMNIQVATVVQEYKISLGIEGNLDKFSLNMSSEPELSKGEITRLLAVGSGNGSNGYNVVTRPIQTFIEDRIEKAVNLDRFTVDVDPLASKSTGSEVTPRVTLGKRLFKDLLLTFSTTVGGSEKAQTVELEYELSDNMSLTVKRDEVGGIDASFTFKFKIK
jgi:autotransporter translocation and assembly factor TamB